MAHLQTPDFVNVREMLDKVNVRYAHWRITEYVDLAHNPVILEKEGYVITFGAEADGPYTEFVFDSEGALIQATANFVETTDSTVTRFVSA